MEGRFGAGEAWFRPRRWSVLLVVLGSLVCLSVAYERPVLRLRADGTFKVLQFTDLHFGIDSETTGTEDSKCRLTLIPFLTLALPF